LKFFYIFIGGGIGSILRFLTSYWVNEKFYNTFFPWGTFTVNIVGSFVIGFLWGVIPVEKLPPEFRDFLFIGMLGGFTTFSSFMLETLNLVRDSEFKVAFLNVVLSALFGFLAVSGGFLLSKSMLKLKGI